MLRSNSLAIAAAAVALAACASEPAYYSQPRYASAAPYPAYADEAARVVAIDREGGSGRSTGAGAVLGGVVGGVRGHQIGSGRGNDAATVAGAVGGAVVGNEVEKRRSSGDRYRVTVRFRDGREATYYQDDLYGLRVGDRVRIEGDRLARY